MSVLPELERSLAEACRREQALATHNRRSRWRKPHLGAAVAMTASVLVVVLVGGALLLVHARRGKPTGRPRQDPASHSPGANQSKSLLEADSIPYAYAADGSVYVVDQARAGRPTFELLRLNPANGRVLARRQGFGTFDQALLVRGVLWVTATGPPNAGRSITWETRHNPGSLAGLSTTRQFATSPAGADVGSLAQAGPWVWAGDWDGIDRLNSATATTSGVTPIHGAHGAQVATDDPTRPSVLLISEGHDRARIQLRDPLTGSYGGQTPPISSVTKPLIGGILDGSAWLSNAGGMAGTYSRINARTLRRQPVNRPVQQYTNAVRAQVIAGILWITQPAGGPQRNYCATPATGAPSIQIPALLSSTLLTADQRYLYSATTGPGPVHLVRSPIPKGCR
jgi:hypothetical protein